MSEININNTTLNLSQGDLSIEEGSMLVFDGDNWVPVTASEDRTENLELRVKELELLVEKLISQLAPEIKL